MRVLLLAGDGVIRTVGAAVVREDGPGLVMEFGPADGPPLTRFLMSKEEAKRLADAVRSVLNGKYEEIVLTDD
jgi:hypothetical protein